MAENVDPKYPLAQTKREAERLHKQHVWQQICMNNQIVFAPVDFQKEDLKVLDVGCAGGRFFIWSLLRDLQKQAPPSAELVGIDLTAGFLPESPQGNIRYSVGNICEAPSDDLVGIFDFTHVRYLLVGCGKVGLDLLIANLLSTLKPGGWLQLQELDVTARDKVGQAVTDFNQILGSIWELTGLGANIVYDLKDALLRAGMKNVHVQRLELPVGRKLANDKDRESSLEPHRLLIPNIIQGAKALGVDLPPSSFDNLMGRFEEEMLEQGAVFTSILVYGQKPH